MKLLPLPATTGRPTGSADSRRLRADGHIPATVYGLGKSTETIAVEWPELRRALSTDAGLNALISLQNDDWTDTVLVKDIQRHPVRRDVLHVDFIRIDPEVAMSIDVPIVLTGEAKAVAAAGGIVEQPLTSLSVSVRPDSIPNELRLDVSGLRIDSTVTVGDLALPDGVTTEVDPEMAVVTAGLTRAAVVASHAGDDDGEESGDAEGDTAESSSDDASDG